MTGNDLFYALVLQHIPNMGDATAKKLIRKFGSAENVLKEKKSALLKLDGIGEAKVRDLQNKEHFKAAEEELKFIEKNNVQTHYFLEGSYPEKLKHCLDSPIILFSRGNINLNKRKIISVVGTRQITAHGITFCEKFIEDLEILNPVIVSGFAYGVDICAHKAAIKNELQTVACLAHGFQTIYPKAHKKYINQMMENGGFYTDFWSTDKFDRNNFLKRNRIIAGLSEATVVIESAEKGGALVTADIASSYDREIFAVPGRPTDKFSSGCNNLIRRQNAHVLTSAADLVYILNWKADEDPKPVQKQLFVQLDSEEQKVYDYLNEQGKTELDALALNCNFPTFKTASLLLNMELKGAVRPLPGKIFEII
ncbi:DNA-processing protein DprA [Gramella sp. AN32]|uniref:DNA-processing protein DprA n=1 Tax=Christiangramia antarctica TaxID=2058158 RepID=A0ABW5X076_9FLAO|nr:DNA-processing protein DprA [Gramella sp. AN32]MCM4155052.1 DNA-protecting protein DprA [Gramella sp. AN32]